MSAEESSSYAPKSPDLSSLFSAGPTDQPPAPPPLSLEHHHHHNFHNHHHHHYHQNTVTPYQQPPPNNTYNTYSNYVPPAAPYGYRPPLDTSHPYSTEQQQQRPPSSHPTNQFVPQTAYEQQSLGFNTATSHAQPLSGFAEQGPGPSTTLQGSSELYGAGQPYFPPTTTATANPEQQQLHLNTQMPPRRAAGPAAAAVEEPLIEPSPVRTKFPTARIKRIMQADEEVGKVAQQTPIAVGKALELFMVQLVSGGADVAKEKGSKRVTASMLKQVVERDDQWDFLREIVSKVEPEKEGSKSKAAKGESESDEDVYEPKKRGRGGRKKKVA